MKSVKVSRCQPSLHRLPWHSGCKKLSVYKDKCTNDEATIAGSGVSSRCVTCGRRAARLRPHLLTLEATFSFRQKPMIDYPELSPTITPALTPTQGIRGPSGKRDAKVPLDKVCRGRPQIAAVGVDLDKSRCWASQEHSSRLEIRISMLANN